MHKPSKDAPFVIYLTVIPFYRQYCIDELMSRLGDRVQLLAGARHCDSSVTTGIRHEQYTPLRNHFFLGRRIFLQTGHWRNAIGAETTILDLNPRCLSSWILAIVRRLFGRRTLLWGHLHPRSGPTARTNWLRTLQRRISNGTILYGYESAKPALEEIPSNPIWVAPNALYPLQLLEPISSSAPRGRLIYVGRLVESKKVDLAIRAHSLSQARREGSVLTIIGSGDAELRLNELCRELDCQDSVEFIGHLTDPARLRMFYSRAYSSVSPGYAGLNLTQSLGFGVPMLVADNEPHAPEIELAMSGNVTFFTSGDAADLSVAIDRAWALRSAVRTEEISNPIRERYSAEAMADGIVRALLDIELDRSSSGVNK